MVTLDSGFAHEGRHAAVSDRAFGLVIGVLLSGIAAWPLLWARPPRLVPLVLGATLLVLAWLAPKLLHWPKIGWLAITMRIAAVVNFILLSIIFFAVVTPVALFFRVTGRDPLRRRFERNLASYWIRREPPATQDGGMRHQF